MVVGKDFLTKVKAFGLNSYEAKLWTALLSRGVSTAGELSDIADVPRSRTYDVLESLEKKGFIIMKIGKPIKYLAVDPKEVINRVQNTIQKDTDVKLSMIEELKDSDILNELSLLHTNGIDSVNPTDYSGSFKNRDSTYDQLEAMFKAAEETITIVTTEDGFKSKINYFEKTLEKVSKRGVKIRIAADIKDNTLIDRIKHFAEIKQIDLKSRFIIIDSKELMFMILDDKDVHPSYDVGIWVNAPFFSSALEKLFELAWKEMKVLN
jgi:HTH-type transcriptional regulator, sugar sensing transcriptional regulator